MKHIVVLAAILLSVSCTNPKQDATPTVIHDTVFVHDTIRVSEQAREWQKGFGLTHDPDKDSIWGKPVSWYIDDDACAALAADFYWGTFRPSDNNATSDLLELATTDNDKLRPFYRWCLDKTIEISDGALGELTGVPTRRYVEKFPREFLEFIDSREGETSREDWAGQIGYSGFYEADDFNKPADVRKSFASMMKSNCSGCDAETIARLEKFAANCFEQAKTIGKE